MIMFPNFNIKDWDWKDLHGKFVKVAFIPADPSLNEFEDTLFFYDVENSKVYAMSDKKRGDE